MYPEHAAAQFSILVMAAVIGKALPVRARLFVASVQQPRYFHPDNCVTVTGPVGVAEGEVVDAETDEDEPVCAVEEDKSVADELESTEDVLWRPVELVLVEIELLSL